MYKEKIVNVQTGQESWRDYTFEEIAEVKKTQAELDNRLTELVEKEIARKAIFDKLGLTEQEAKLLLG